ncbi:hypothetical protein Goklo_020433 [Gossypium klotzschianum]|uniref:Uncharacterized protein n=1 Tax=Gossypium klotzschianum TaxID=34286 RepID=A0A7J8URT8_9ROSI|nr:hypothetical protein [Gossypium klotzschianum]
MDVPHGQSSISFKNTPVLKATASRLCGPLFDWIVTWEMLSRIKYLGTMLFLHNFEKAVQCLWTVLRAIRSFLSFLNLPLAGPFMEFLDFLFPVWNMFSEAIESFFSVICIGIGFIISLVGDLLEVVLIPICFIGLVLRNITTSVLYPMFLILWEILCALIRLVLALASFLAYVCGFIYDVVGNICDTSHKGPTQAQECDGLKLPQGPITRSKARQMHSKLNGTIQEFVSKALDAYMRERENQDSLSCFQENQETES